jgi:hypothetical protein
MLGIKETPPTIIFKQPRYEHSVDYIWSLPESQRMQKLGVYEGEDVFVVLVGHVPCQLDFDEEYVRFSGTCEMKISDESPTNGVILGSIFGTGTGIIVDRENRLLAYRPADAVDYGWEKLSDGAAEIRLDDNGMKVIKVSRMEVVALGDE